MIVIKISKIGVTKKFIVFFVSGFDDPFSILDIFKMSIFQKGL